MENRVLTIFVSAFQSTFTLAIGRLPIAVAPGKDYAKDLLVNSDAVNPRSSTLPSCLCSSGF